MSRFLTDRKLLSEFKKQLDSAERVDFASAWATEGPALKALAEGTYPVRALVGLQHGVTTPAALQLLKEACDLRIVVPGARLFHPKVYLFHRRRSAIAWIGSANFTGKGFASNDKGNEEAVFETHVVPAIADWFERCWDKAGPLDKDVLERYCEGYEHPKRGALDERPPPGEDVVPADAVFLETISDWRDKNPHEIIVEPILHAAILQAFDVIGVSGSRREVLDVVEEILEPVLRDGDNREVQKNVKAWEHRADNARWNFLLAEGLFQPTKEAGWGQWVLTKKGQRAAATGDWGSSWRRFAEG